MPIVTQQFWYILLKANTYLNLCRIEATESSWVKQNVFVIYRDVDTFRTVNETQWKITQEAQLVLG